MYETAEGTLAGPAGGPALPADLAAPGVAGNSRLTGGAAVMLLVLLAAEGVTVPLIGALREEHILIGMLLIPPVMLKLGSTGYRFARYYTHSPAYVRKGPPPVLLRLLAPGVVLTTIALFATGVALLLVGPPSGTLSFLHKASFIAWFALMAIHVLGHLLGLPRLALPDWRRHGPPAARLAGSGARIGLLGGVLAAGVALAAVSVPLAGAWL
jgi:hypothetical protein